MISQVILVESIGWVATAVVALSFFFGNPRTLRIVQIFGAVLWLLYGAAIESLPVIVANALIISVASWTIIAPEVSRRRKVRRRAQIA